MMVDTSSVRYFIFAIFLALGIVFTASPAQARAGRGFHTGPYILLQGGVMQASFDGNVATGTKNGRDFEPSFGLSFGWNIWDFFSTEINGRYTTSANSGKREHIASAGLYAKGFWVTKKLTRFESWRVLPFARAGIATTIAALPGADGASDGTVTSYGIGPSLGVGMMFLWNKYIYFGVDAFEDLLYFNNIYQTVNGVPNTLIYKGGYHPAFNAMAVIGVHY